ncbi:hypothetical protein Dshi_2782 [Dinoroseobacter shibae DFL 12 = DSM 16493]|jgi:hypothetical protein|uniref:PAS fold-4 domain-containing protein n=1 Tax=Dinoroseobacter shibae (strain DSM 16493 / NCIMB 14021 / DFL 12) TaxID=398580 RepID=A8LJ20_DINSH|nr:PAS domain-containing protein [Dinoroseobacter shibae]ABV94515.1 hypothetical protein Dshi_2782 [Dinoroseobacter shibae DFL 12 = DSM 16493]URF45943.1 PAS domain-containing protein [Dinoroseobacter shibae]URF50249.1 PAS domain-containing protein [Dinoroseobacter shibae]
MEDIPGNFGPRSGLFALDPATSTKSESIHLSFVHGLLDVMAAKLGQSLLLISDNGTILAVSGAEAFPGGDDLRGARWTSLWPKESRPLALGALEMAVTELRELTIQISRMPDPGSAQFWEAVLSPLPLGETGTGPARKSAVLVALREITAARRVAHMRSRAG